jgi:hypothetical protein
MAEVRFSLLWDVEIFGQQVEKVTDDVVIYDEMILWMNGNSVIITTAKLTHQL